MLPMRIDELIKLLQKLPPDADAYIPDVVKAERVKFVDERDPGPQYEQPSKTYTHGRVKL